MSNDDADAERCPLRVAVVGHCASGKSTLVSALRSQGFDAGAVAQEHSGVMWLWRHSEPDLLIYLDVPLATIRDRRGQEWPQAVYDAQEERLTDARTHADLIIDTSAATISEMTRQALAFVRDNAIGKRDQSDAPGRDRIRR